MDNKKYSSKIKQTRENFQDFSNQSVMFIKNNVNSKAMFFLSLKGNIIRNLHKTRDIIVKYALSNVLISLDMIDFKTPNEKD